MVEFANPVMLWALGAVSVPILIHLLYRRRFRRVEWAAMAFLQQADLRVRRKVALQNLLLLALRVLAVALLVLTFARPGAGRPLPGLGAIGEEKTSLFVLLDDSPSMGQRVGDDSVFRTAVGGLTGAVARLAAQHARVSVTLYVSSRDKPLCHTDMLSAADVERIRSALGGLEPTAVAFDTERQLDGLAARARVAGARNVVFYIVTDLRAVDWTSAQAPVALRPTVTRALARLQDAGRVVVADTAPAEVPNVGLAGVREVEPVTYADSASSWWVTVQNQTAAALGPGRIQVTADGGVLPPAPTPAVPPGGSREAPVNLVLQAGWHGMEFRLPSQDAFAADDAAFLAVECRKDLPVLLIEGAPGLRESEGSAYYVRAALSPDGAQSAVRADVRFPWALSDVALSDYAAVVLSNVADPTEALPALLRYVEDGGGLIVFLGDKVDRERWNASVLDPEHGLLPARLTAHVDLSGKERPASLAALDFSDPLLGPFKAWESLFSLVQVRTFWGVEPVGRTAVLARFAAETQSPAMLLARAGRGTTLLVTTSANDKWTDWPRSEVGRVTFVPLLHRAVELMARAGSQELNLTAGSPLRFRLDPARYAREAKLWAPAAGGALPEPAPLRAEALEGRPGMWVVSEPLRNAGLWRLELRTLGGSPENVYLAVNMRQEERDLRRAPVGAVRSAARRPDSFSVVRFDAAQLAGLQGVQRTYWKPIAQILVVVLIVESVLAFFFGNPRGARERT